MPIESKNRPRNDEKFGIIDAIGFLRVLNADPGLILKEETILKLFQCGGALAKLAVLLAEINQVLFDKKSTLPILSEEQANSLIKRYLQENPKSQENFIEYTIISIKVDEISFRLQQEEKESVVTIPIAVPKSIIPISFLVGIASKFRNFFGPLTAEQLNSILKKAQNVQTIRQNEITNQQFILDLPLLERKKVWKEFVLEIIKKALSGKSIPIEFDLQDICKKDGKFLLLDFEDFGTISNANWLAMIGLFSALLLDDTENLKHRIFWLFNLQEKNISQHRYPLKYLETYEGLPPIGQIKQDMRNVLFDFLKDQNVESLLVEIIPLSAKFLAHFGYNQERLKQELRLSDDFLAMSRFLLTMIKISKEICPSETISDWLGWFVDNLAEILDAFLQSFEPEELLKTKQIFNSLFMQKGLNQDKNWWEMFRNIETNSFFQNIIQEITRNVTYVGMKNLAKYPNLIVLFEQIRNCYNSQSILDINLLRQLKEAVSEQARYLEQMKKASRG